jgi:hypothetical protein
MLEFVCVVCCSSRICKGYNVAFLASKQSNRQISKQVIPRQNYSVHAGRFSYLNHPASGNRRVFGSSDSNLAFGILEKRICAGRRVMFAGKLPAGSENA